MTTLFPLQEFIAGGYLAEVNRRFLHPLGLALGVELDRLVVLDAREDDEGHIFAAELMDEVSRKAALVASEEAIRFPARRARLGYITQPVDTSSIGQRADGAPT